jgi:HD-GYP domain-containing protein (c-di-GMP phosphodiesterase class II)
MSRMSGIRLAEVLGAMSLAVDLGIGQPMGHVARSCLLARALARTTDVPERTDEHLYFVTLMGWVGCIADSHEAAAWFGDDIDYRAGVYDLDMRPLPFLGYLLRRAGHGQAAPVRAWRAAAVVATGAHGVQDSLRAHCQVTEHVARRLGLAEPVCTALRQVFARWDGQGLPKDLSREQIEPTIRLWQVADVAEVHHARGGIDSAVRVVRERRGSQFDPDLVDVFCANARELFAEVPDDPDTTWDDVVAAQPGLASELTDTELDTALSAVADWMDLKSPCFTGHSSAVARLAARAATRLGMSEDEVRLVHRAGLVHDLGRLGVPNTIWDKATPLTSVEVERIRLHSYYTERMLARPEALARIGAVAAAAHERLDGSGYHRGRSGADLPLPARVLAVAECYRTALEERPHRPAAEPPAAAAALRDHARAGQLDPAAVDAVLSASGHRGAPPPGPSGLTPREQQVLALLVRGRTNRQVARALGISAKTVGNHVEHIYTKAGVGTRAAATLWAMEHGLL